jgi:phage gp46-like protein
VSDIKCRTGDFEIFENDLATDEGLETAVMQSLFTDRRDDESGKGGWWADTFPVVDGDRWGSRLWLLNRVKKIQSTLDLAAEYAKEALAWLVTDGVAEKVDSSAIFEGDGYVLFISITRPTGVSAQFRFAKLWEVAWLS